MPSINFIGQGIKTLEHYEHTHTQADRETDATKHITCRILGW